ncbi:hypothetical protein HYH02_004586 [Chlamydomonas schloesseri]|uniref:Uncharacterized protein n=1 Tax=Chlamydomonas schloesseri TaxID=2026947 RepID=A0A835WMX4_9CHLO|nr:hypothetical protein HYH02_004586 [Chlamydomonas schloesseri]|eukprot:KAG2450749.1 hypothetical protein HYH02_004586 [Chlamydomonas schloesseri]
MPCIMFVGLDGSGKTTIVNTLLEEARRLKVEEQRAKEEARAAARQRRHAQRAAAANGQDARGGGGGGGGGGAASSTAVSSRDTSVRDSQHAVSKAVTGVTEDRRTTRTAYGRGTTNDGTEASTVGEGAGEGGGGGGGVSEKARRARDAIQPPPPAPSECGMLYALPQGVLRHECVLMDTPGGFFQRRRYLGGLQLATAVVLCVDAADEGRFPVVRDFFVQHVLPEVCRRHLPLLLVATKRDVCDWGAAEDVALDLDLAILMAHVAAPWTAAHVVGGQLGLLREPLTWLLQQSAIVDHLWHSWPSSAPVLLHYQQANARYAVGMASKKAIELFHDDDAAADDQERQAGLLPLLEGAAAAAAGGAGAIGMGGMGVRVAAGPLPALAASGSIHISAVTSLAPLSSTPQLSVGMVGGAAPA